MSCDWKTCPTCNKLIWAYKLSPKQVNEMGGFCVCREYPEYEHVRYPCNENGICTVTMAELCGMVEASNDKMTGKELPF